MLFGVCGLFFGILRLDMMDGVFCFICGVIGVDFGIGGVGCGLIVVFMGCICGGFIVIGGIVVVICGIGFCICGCLGFEVIGFGLNWLNGFICIWGLIWFGEGGFIIGSFILVIVFIMGNFILIFWFVCLKGLKGECILFCIFLCWGCVFFCIDCCWFLWGDCGSCICFCEGGCWGLDCMGNEWIIWFLKWDILDLRVLGILEIECVWFNFVCFWVGFGFGCFGSGLLVVLNWEFKLEGFIWGFGLIIVCGIGIFGFKFGCFGFIVVCWFLKLFIWVRFGWGGFFGWFGIIFFKGFEGLFSLGNVVFGLFIGVGNCWLGSCWFNKLDVIGIFGDVLKVYLVIVDWYFYCLLMFVYVRYGVL